MTDDMWNYKVPDAQRRRVRLPTDTELDRWVDSHTEDELDAWVARRVAAKQYHAENGTAYWNTGKNTPTNQNTECRRFDVCGTPWGYGKGCRADECRTAKNAAQKAWRTTQRRKRAL